MALILSLETSVKVCSVSIYSDNELLGVSEVFIEKSHSRVITLLVQDLLKGVNITLNEIDAVSVSHGPGSYTGLRIGVSTAKGLCYALDKPLISVNTLQGMAASVADSLYEDILICPMLDARRMEVYCAVYDGRLKEIQKTSAVVVDETSFRSLLENNKVLFCGNGAGKCKKLLGHAPNAYFLDNVYPSAKYTGRLANVKYMKGEFEDLAYFEPYYLKEFFLTGKKSN
ncbi:tRNA (adenosine(37)-N6)-threonylcarbamoyltransferase complex dimerization subunit type 1 TsaB [Cytophagaceae bacterium ABcell3]|nr:tRNA (adenosine(37)-N6)-threonylcarbamoyltransferase complex dimerization subunit type 1 TsaB [Cytophagaceae bacterium ABcell3]